MTHSEQIEKRIQKRVQECANFVENNVGYDVLISHEIDCCRDELLTLFQVPEWEWVDDGNGRHSCTIGDTTYYVGVDDFNEGRFDASRGFCLSIAPPILVGRNMKTRAQAQEACRLHLQDHVWTALGVKDE